MTEKKPSPIEDQALTVFHFWFADGPNSERAAMCLNGMFEMLEREYPEAYAEAQQDAIDRRNRERA